MNYADYCYCIEIVSLFQTGQYPQFDDFHADMLLVRNNCLTYNPPQTRVYRDCNQVFNYYNQEIDKMLDKSGNKVQQQLQNKQQN
jgi:hypothetical protein